MQPRTQRQKEILEYITGFIERHGYEPSYKQIALHFGVSSKATIAKHITALERRGLLSRSRSSGSFNLLLPFDDVQESVVEVQMLGRIAAGAPFEAVETPHEKISIPRFLLGRVSPSQVYALRVVGDSMIDEHICDGDIALIENRTDVRDGEIIVALIEGETTTLKRLYRSGAEVELRAANSQVPSIRLPAVSVRVQGIFRGLLRPAQ